MFEKHLVSVLVILTLVYQTSSDGRYDKFLKKEAKIDIAKGKQTIASSEDWPSSYAVNGSIYYPRPPSNAKKKCFRSKKSKEGSWLQVDLGKLYRMKFMEVHPRRYIEYNLDFLSVYVSNVSATAGDVYPPYQHMSLCQTIGKHNTSDVKNITCTTALYGRYVIAVYNKSDHLSICTWQIFQCKNMELFKRYGRDCVKCDCNDNICDMITGECICSPLVPLYGKKCDQKCPCPKNHLCDVKTGACGSCVPGYTGGKCDKLCPRETWGMGCKRNCNCVKCNTTDGRCESDCAPGFLSMRICQTPCTPGKYGFNCMHTCSLCQDKTEICDKASGRCSACPPGKQLPTCEKDCENKYGDMCRYECHCLHKVCDPVSGACSNNDCAPGFMSEIHPPFNCRLKTCENIGKFGEKCDKMCHCKNNTRCVQTTGRCLNGCAENFRGKHCNVSPFGLGRSAWSASTKGAIASAVCGCLLLVAVFTYKRRRDHSTISTGLVKPDGVKQTRTAQKEETVSKQFTCATTPRGINDNVNDHYHVVSATGNIQKNDSRSDNTQKTYSETYSENDRKKRRKKP